MSIKFYNTLSREKEAFIPLVENEVKIYTCGPTVYSYAHIGNLRAYVFADILKRVLQYEGYAIKHVMNITDIDDKTIRDSQKENKSLKEFTEFYTNEFLKDIKSLNILDPSKFVKATDYIDEIVAMIEKLIDKKLAYQSSDGSVYFDIKKFKDYGQLAHLDLTSLKENAQGRVQSDEYQKENPQDFALWKAYDKKDGEVFWDPSTILGISTKLGKGRPGWHIECSAMSIKNLGEQIDIHTGGVDNIFPHHENEKAQSEGLTGKQFVKYWLHNEWVLVDQKKMAKSENNFYTLKDLIEKEIDPIVYRFWLLMANYRSRINFVWEALQASEVALKRLYRLYLDLGDNIGEINKEYQNKFKVFLADDLDTPRALSLLWDLIKDTQVSSADKKATILDFDKVLGLGFQDLKEDEINDEVKKLAEEREQARKNKDFKKSDELRAKINSLGYEIKDIENGYKINKI